MFLEWNFCTRLKNWLWIVKYAILSSQRLIIETKQRFQLKSNKSKMLNCANPWFLFFFGSCTGTWSNNRKQQKLLPDMLVLSYNQVINSICCFCIHCADSSVIQLMYTLDIHIHFDSCLLCILSGIFKSFIYFWGHKTPFLLVLCMSKDLVTLKWYIGINFLTFKAIKHYADGRMGPLLWCLFFKGLYFVKSSGVYFRINYS